MDLDTTWVRLRDARRVTSLMLSLGFVCGLGAGFGICQLLHLSGHLI